MGIGVYLLASPLSPYFIIALGPIGTIMHFGTGIVVFKYGFSLNIKRSIIYTLLISLIYGLSWSAMFIYWLNNFFHNANIEHAKVLGCL